LVLLDEIILIRIITSLTLTEVPPAAADKIGDDDRDDD